MPITVEQRVALHGSDANADGRVTTDELRSGIAACKTDLADAQRLGNANAIAKAQGELTYLTGLLAQAESGGPQAIVYVDDQALALLDRLALGERKVALAADMRSDSPDGQITQGEVRAEATRRKLTPAQSAPLNGAFAGNYSAGRRAELEGAPSYRSSMIRRELPATRPEASVDLQGDANKDGVVRLSEINSRINWLGTPAGHDWFDAHLPGESYEGFVSQLGALASRIAAMPEQAMRYVDLEDQLKMEASPDLNGRAVFLIKSLNQSVR
jgi:hypothetical protein